MGVLVGTQFMVGSSAICDRCTRQIILIVTGDGIPRWLPRWTVDHSPDDTNRLDCDSKAGECCTPYEERSI